MSDLFPDPLGGGPNPFEDNGGLADDPVYENSETPCDPDSFPAKRSQSAASALRRYYLILLAGGLILGVFVSVGVIKAIQHFGLNEVPSQVEMQSN